MQRVEGREQLRVCRQQPVESLTYPFVMRRCSVLLDEPTARRGHVGMADATSDQPDRVAKIRPIGDVFEASLDFRPLAALQRAGLRCIVQEREMLQSDGE